MAGHVLFNKLERLQLNIGNCYVTIWSRNNGIENEMFEDLTTVPIRSEPEPIRTHSYCGCYCC